jgi:hypothetical protein
VEAAFRAQGSVGNQAPSLQELAFEQFKLSLGGQEKGRIGFFFPFLSGFCASRKRVFPPTSSTFLGFMVFIVLLDPFNFSGYRAEVVDVKKAGCVGWNSFKFCMDSDSASKHLSTIFY